MLLHPRRFPPLRIFGCLLQSNSLPDGSRSVAQEQQAQYLLDRAEDKYREQVLQAEVAERGRIMGVEQLDKVCGVCSGGWRWFSYSPAPTHEAVSFFFPF